MSDDDGVDEDNVGGFRFNDLMGNVGDLRGLEL